MRVHLARVVRGVTGQTNGYLADLLLKQVEAAAAGAVTARDAAEGTISSGEARTRLAAIEHEGDAARGRLVTEVSFALVTPLDPEDMFRVSRSIDNVLDDLRDFVREMDLFDAADHLFIPVIDSVIEGLLMLRDAIESVTTQPTELGERILAAKKSCNAVRRHFEVELSELLSGQVTVEMLRRRELLRRLDGVGLRLAEAIDALADAAVKRMLQ